MRAEGCPARPLLVTLSRRRADRALSSTRRAEDRFQLNGGWRSTGDPGTSKLAGRACALISAQQ